MENRSKEIRIFFNSNFFFGSPYKLYSLWVCDYCFTANSLSFVVGEPWFILLFIIVLILLVIFFVLLFCRDKLKRKREEGEYLLDSESASFRQSFSHFLSNKIVLLHTCTLITA